MHQRQRDLRVAVQRLASAHEAVVAGHVGESVFLVLDRDARNGAGIVPMMIIDRSGRTVATSSQCWIARGPDINFDRVCVGRTWIITATRLEWFAGGN